MPTFEGRLEKDLGVKGREQKMMSRENQLLARSAAESTGWVLVDAANQRNQLDVAAVRAEAERLLGSDVQVEGTTTTRKYLKRGETQIIIAEKIVVGLR